MSDGSEIMAGCGWFWVVVIKLWLNVGCIDKIVAIGGGCKIRAGCGWLWMVAQFSIVHYQELVRDVS